MSRIRLSLCVVGISLFGLLPPFESQAQVGIIDASGRSIESVGSIGAVANRRAADNLFQDAINDERRAISKFPPNVGLLSKALVQTMSGIKADNQSRANGRAAIESLRVGDSSGIVDVTKEYGQLNRAQIQHYASHSSPHLPQVEKTLAKYGMGVSSDRQSLTSPIGNIPLDLDPKALSDLISKVVEQKGLSSEGVKEGVQAGIDNQNAIGKEISDQARAELERLTKGLQDDRQKEGTDEGASGGKEELDGENQGAMREDLVDQESDQENSGEKSGGMERAAFGIEPSGNRGPAGLGGGGGGTFSLEAEGGPIAVKGASHQDIFEMITIRYQIRKSQGTFLE